MSKIQNDKFALNVIAGFLLVCLAFDLVAMILSLTDGTLSVAGIMAENPSMTEGLARCAFILSLVVTGLVFIAGLYMSFKAFRVASGKSTHTRLAVFFAWIAIILAGIMFVTEAISFFSHLNAISFNKVLSVITAFSQVLVFVYYVLFTKKLASK